MGNPAVVCLVNESRILNGTFGVPARLTGKKGTGAISPCFELCQVDSPQPTLKVLVVEDPVVYRKQVEQTLAYHPSYERFVACDGEEALRIYRERVPSIVVTDWMMPDFSGIELCQRIRAEKALPCAYVIMMTSNTDKGRAAQALEAGADDYVAKPFDRTELLARIGVGQMVELHRELQSKNANLEEQRVPMP